MKDIFSASKPDARLLILQILAVSILSFSVQRVLAMMLLFGLTELLCIIFIGLKETGKNLIIYSLLWLTLYVLGHVNIPVISLIFPMFMMLIIRILPASITCQILVRRIPMNELMASLRKLHIPMIILIPMVVMYRYLPTVGKEIVYVQESCKMRGLSPSIERFFVPLLFRSEKISEELSAATLCKGLNVEQERTCLTDVKLCGIDYIYGLALIMCAALVSIINCR